MKVLVTGAEQGIGRAAASHFLSMGHQVIGFDVLPHDEFPRHLEQNYTHHICDVSDESQLPEVEGVEILINNAGVQEGTLRDLDVNLVGTINCTEKYGVHPGIKSILNVASVSGHNGAEYPIYCASKGGMLAYTVNTAKRIAEYRATCNSISPGGVYTGMTTGVVEDPDKWNKIMSMTPMKGWATPDEIAEWIYFFTVCNKSCTAQDLIIDNGESFNHVFVE